MVQYKSGYYKYALLTLVFLLPQPGHTTDATWITPSNVTGTWGDGPNWTGGTAPNGVNDIARFNTEASALVIAPTTLNTLDLQAIGLGETVIIDVRDVFTVNTALTNTSNGSFTFESNTGSGVINFNNNVLVANNAVIQVNEGTINFNNASVANGVVFNIQGTNSNVGRVTMNNNSQLNNSQVTVDGNAIIDFPDLSTSSITLSSFINQNGGETRFANGGSLDPASITNENNGSLIVTNGALVNSGVITNNTKGITRISGAGSAGGATYNNLDATNDPTPARLIFEDDGGGVGGLGGLANIINGNNSETLFSGHSDAQQANITNQANSQTSFQDLTTANQASILNESQSQLLFLGSSTGGTSSITNNLGALTQFLGSSVPGTGSIHNDGDLLFTQTTNTNCGSTITGTGPVTLNMPGQNLTYQFSNIKTYSGLTNIISGTLVAGSTNSFSPNSVIAMPAITAAQVNLATLSQVVGGLSNGSNASLIDATNATLTIDTANPGLVFSGIINGVNGNLTKQGTGKQSLHNNHTYTGITTVDNGELNVNGSLTSPVLVNAGGTFSGNATVNSINSVGGTVSPGNSIGTITTLGNFDLDNASNFILEIAPNFTNDLVQAGLQANIDGTLTIEPQAGSYVFNVQPYRFITTGLANGVNGTFATVTSTSSLLFNVVYGPNYVQLFVTNPNASLASIPTNHNAHHFLNYLQKIQGQIPVGSQLSNVLGALNALTVNQIGHALEHLEPSPLINFSDISHELNQASTKIMGLQTAFYRLQSQISHMIEDMGDASGQMVQGFLSSLQSTTQSIQNQVSKFLRVSQRSLPHDQKHLQATPTQLQMPHDLRTQFGKANIWFQQNGQHFKLGSHGEHAGLLARTHTSSVGMDYKVCENLLLGMMLSAGRSYLNWEKDRGSGRVSSYHLGIYGSWLSQNKKWYVDFNTVLGRHRFSAHRNIKIPGFAVKGKSNHWGTFFSNDVESGYTVNLPKQMSLQPYVFLGYFLLGEKGYNEHGAGNAGVNVKGRISQFLRTGTGLEMAKIWACREWIIRPSLRLGYSFQHSLGATKRLRSSLIHNPGHFTVTGGRKSHHLFNGAVNVNAITKKGISVGLTYNTQVNSKYKVHEGFVRLGWAF